MEKQDLLKLYRAIKSDDVKLFTSFMLSKSDLNISFGRFPILSLCYLYKAEAILNKFEKFMMPINKFEIVDEYFEIYKNFRTLAKRSIKLVACQERVIYPLEMLAFLDERNLIRNKYKFLYKNEEILQNVQKIYNLNQEIDIIATPTKFVCKAKKLSVAKKVVSGLVAIVFCLLSVFSVLSMTMVAKTYGRGTASSPITISTEQELLMALKKGNRYYLLKNDISLGEEINVENFTGTLDGGEYTIYLKENSSQSVITNLSGTIKNANFEFEVNNATFSKNYAILTENNTGIIENCTFLGNLSGEFNTQNDIYLAGVAVQNAGTISNVIVNLNADVSNHGQTNAYLAGVVGVNNGLISNVITSEADFVSDTVDLAGIASENYGTISGVTNNISLTQTSSKEWHPNCAGIAMMNYGSITSCVNRGDILATSTAIEVPKQDNGEDGELHVYAAGVACNNFKEIKKSRNFANVSAIGKVSYTFAGGIVALNVTDEKYSYNDQNVVVCVIDGSKSTAKISSKSEAGLVYAGGVCAVNNTQILNCGFEGTIDATTSHEFSSESLLICAGGVAGLNSACPLQNSYADVTFENVQEEAEGYFKAYGGVIGYMGSSSTRFGGNVTSLGSGYNYLLNNHYVENGTTNYATYGLTYEITTASSAFEKVYAEGGAYFIKYSSINEIPEGVRIYE